MDKTKFVDVILAGCATLIFIATLPFLLPFWLIGKLVIWSGLYGRIFKDEII